MTTESKSYVNELPLRMAKKDGKVIGRATVVDGQKIMLEISVEDAAIFEMIRNTMKWGGIGSFFIGVTYAPVEKEESDDE